jgi:hypothetical protein
MIPRSPTDNEKSLGKDSSHPLGMTIRNMRLHLESFGALRINSVRDLSLILFSKEAAKSLARQSRNQRSIRRTHRRGTEDAELGVLLDKIPFSAYSASPR